MQRHRRCVVLRGEPASTRAQALALLGASRDEDVLWVGEGDVRFTTATRTSARRLLGRAFDAVVLDLHRGADADLLGLCHGFVWGGGWLVLRMPPPGAHAPDEALAVPPFTAADVTTRFAARLERALSRGEVAPPSAPLAAPPRAVRGTDEQRALVEALARSFTSGAPAISVVIADRGRGKSSALGLALAEAARGRPLRAVVTAPTERSVLEVRRFAPPGAGFVDPLELARGEPDDERDPEVIVVDEAAQLPVPLLTRIVLRHPRARIALATTARGYEGTGRGFVLRFLAWLETLDRPLASHRLVTPIRWAAGDPLERLVFDALLLDAEPASLERASLERASLERASLEPDVDLARVRHAHLDRDTLAADERLLREVFGLLVHAHYRTTPGDLARLLDAPNLAVHASFAGERVVAATLVAREGELAEDELARLASGAARVRGHALAETLCVHAARPEAGRLSMIRSVRIAVHPSARRRGVARALVEHVHASYSPDLFGTLFGATPELLAFRREVGYALVRLGVSRGARSGEPSAVMLRPVSAEANALVRALREDLARDLPLQLALLEDELALDPRLPAELAEGLASPPPLSDRECLEIARRYTESSRPFEAAAYAITRAVTERAGGLAALDACARALVTARVLERRSWARAAREAGYESVPAAMRALRPAIAALLKR